jgi:hypothetical protein
VVRALERLPDTPERTGQLARLGWRLPIGGSIQMLLVAVPLVGWLTFTGLTWRAAVLIGLALSFSSTVLVFQSLAEKKPGQVRFQAGKLLKKLLFRSRNRTCPGFLSRFSRFSRFIGRVGVDLELAPRRAAAASA